MTNVMVSKELNTAAEAVWQVVGGWNTLPAWHPEVAASTVESDGLIRKVQLADGTVITERLEHFDRARYQYTYIILESPLPLLSYRSTITVEPSGDGAIVTWSTEFEGKGAPEDEIAETLRGFYRVGLDSAERLLADR